MNENTVYGWPGFNQCPSKKKTPAYLDSGTKT